MWLNSGGTSTGSTSPPSTSTEKSRPAVGDPNRAMRRLCRSIYTRCHAGCSNSEGNPPPATRSSSGKDRSHGDAEKTAGDRGDHQRDRGYNPRRDVQRELARRASGWNKIEEESRVPQKGRAADHWISPSALRTAINENAVPVMMFACGTVPRIATVRAVETIVPEREIISRRDGQCLVWRAEQLHAKTMHLPMSGILCSTLGVSAIFDFPRTSRGQRLFLWRVRH